MSSVYKLVLVRLEVGASTQSVLGFTESWYSLQVGTCKTEVATSFELVLKEDEMYRS